MRRKQTKSIRQSTFETNSSSAHSLTICRKSLREKLQNRDLFYVGPFRKFSDMDETFVNEILEKNCITVEEAIKRVKKYVTSENYSIADNLTLDMLTPEFVKENYWNKDFGIYNLFYDVLDRDRDHNYISAEDLFASENSDSYLEEDVKSYELRDEDFIELYHINMNA